MGASTFLIFPLALLLVACGASSGNGGGESLESAQVEPTTAESELLTLVNQHRASLGLGPLVASAPLETEIQRHADAMADGLFLGHEGMTGRCASVREQLGGGNLCGEVVARGQATPGAALAGWLASPAHRVLIEDGRYNLVGLGTAKDVEGRDYWGMLFLER